MTLIARPALESYSRTLRLSFYLGWQDLRLMYRRSVLGQFWVTVSMGVTFAVLGLVFGFVLGTPLPEYLPHLGVGLVVFVFFSSVINDGAMSFLQAEQFIKQLPLPPVTYFLRSVWRSMFILMHNAVALLVLLIVLPQGISWVTLLVIPGFILATLAISGIALGVAMLATRYGDVPQIVASVMQVAFYLTPIIWMPESMPAVIRDKILVFNPLYHLVEVVREPLLNKPPSLTNWVATLILVVVGLAVGIGAYRWKRRRLAFWV